MKHYVPLAAYPQEPQNQADALERWRASHKENLAFREYIESPETGLNACGFDGFYVDRDGAYANLIIEKFGFERTLYMLANTVRHKDYDGRFPHDIKVWAHSMQDIASPEITRAYLIDKINPGILDLFTKRIQRMEKEFQMAEQQNVAVQELDSDRVRHLFSKALNWIAEMDNGGALYETLHETLGMTNEEIEAVGFSLKEYYMSDEQEPNQQDGMQM